MALPSETVTVDIHCVTRWSKLDTDWRGVSLDTLLADVETGADFALVHSYGGYTTNLPLEDLLDGQAWVAYEYDGDDLAAEHGGPARLLVPHLYFWKSAKWVRGIELMLAGRPRLLGAARLPRLRRPMARAAVPGGLRVRRAWRPARRSSSGGRRRRAPRTLVLEVPGWPGHLAGQHVDVRLTAAGRLPGRPQLLARRACRRRPASRSPCSACPTARCRRYLVDDWRPGTRSRCADRSAAGSSGGPSRPRRCCWSRAARASYR